MKKFFNKNNNIGITLIALVITIVVLIILAGVAINLSLGENGLFNKAKYAKDQYQTAANDEIVALSNYEKTIANLTSEINGSRDISQEELENTINGLIEAKLSAITPSFNVLNGTVVTNTMPGSNQVAEVNRFTITENGNYLIVYNGALNWGSGSAIGLYLIKGESTEIAKHMYSNYPEFTYGGINLTTIQSLNAGDVLHLKIYQYANGGAGVNNLAQNELKLVKLGN